jgi:hypothetical protein
MKKANAGNITISVALLKDKNKKNEPLNIQMGPIF